MQPTVNAAPFYGEYHGHLMEHLREVHAGVRGSRSVVWLLGDSTLDNKHWVLNERVPAINGYEHVLSPPRSAPDVPHHLNSELLERGYGDRLVVINTSVEASTLGQRGGSRPLWHSDEFCRDNMRADDVLVCSIGGNDIALAPTVMTGVAMMSLLTCPSWLIRSLGSSPLFFRLVPGLGHFVDLFGHAAQKFVERVCAKTSPRLLVMCMLYYLDEAPGGSWADHTLSMLGYNANPEKLQLIMRIVFERAISEVRLGQTQVVPVPLYEALDGKDTDDYVARVEPSSQGGQKMAKLLIDRLLAALSQPGTTT